MKTTNPLLCLALSMMLLPCVACGRGVTTETDSRDAAPLDVPGPPAVTSDAASFAPSLVANDAMALTEGSLPDAPEAFLPDASEASVDAGPATISIDGTVTDTAGNPATSRTINVLDGADASHVAVTDALGRFAMTSVVTPYTLTVSGPAGATLGQLSYLGVSTPTPQLIALPANGATVVPSAPFTLTIAVPACGTASCLVSINGASPAGQLYSLRATVAGGASLPISDVFRMPGAGPAQATFNVLVSDSVFSRYWFAQTTATLTVGGPSTSLGTLTPTTIPNATTLTVTSAPEGIVSSWPVPSEVVFLVYPGGVGTVELAVADSTVLSSGIPDILGATVTVRSIVFCETDGGPPQFSYAASADLALTSTSAALTLLPPATWLSPSTAGQAVSSASALSWQPSVATGFAFVALQDQQGNITLAFTPGTTLSVGTLAKTGVVPSAGDYVLSVAEITPASSLDAVLESGSILQLLTMAYAGASWEGSASLHITLTP